MFEISFCLGFVGKWDGSFSSVTSFDMFEVQILLNKMFAIKFVWIIYIYIHPSSTAYLSRDSQTFLHPGIYLDLCTKICKLMDALFTLNKLEMSHSVL